VPLVTFGIVRKFLQHTSIYHPVRRLDDAKKPNETCVPLKGMSCIRLAGFGVRAPFALMSPFDVCGIFSGMKGKSVLGDMAFPFF